MTDLPVHDVVALATTDGRLYVQVNPGPVERIDPSSGGVLATSVSLPAGVLLVSGDTLWLVSSRNAGGDWTADAYELDPGDLALQETVVLPVLPGTNMGGATAAANSTSIWFSTGKVYGRLDPKTGAVTTQGAVPDSDGTFTGVAVDAQNDVYLVTDTPIANTLTPLGPAVAELVQQRNATTGALQATTTTDTHSPLEDLSGASTDGFWGSEILSGADPSDRATPGAATFTSALLFVASGTLRADRIITATYTPATAGDPQVTNPWTSVSGGAAWFNDGTIGCASPLTHAVLAEDDAPIDSMQGAVVVGGALVVPTAAGGLVRLTPPAACRVAP